MDDATKIGLFKSLFLARVFEEKKTELAVEIARTDIKPTSCIGQEAIPVGFCYGLNRDDYILPSIRSAWAADITKGLPLKTIAAEMYGRSGGLSNGREISALMTCMELGIIGGTGVLAGTITVAAGLALAATYRKTKQIAVCFFGDGASCREEFYSGLNFAAIRKLPVVYVVENNQIAEFTPIRKFMPVENIADRAVAFGIPGKIVDGNDVLAVYETAREAIQRARDGQGPTLVECKTCRIRPMSEMPSEAEPEKVLPQHVIEEWKRRDPVKRLSEALMESGLMSAEAMSALRGQFQKEVDEAFAFAEQSPYAPPEEVFRDVYAEGLEVKS
ncbi:MAG: thiamine pyrophosphate-dependent dehydrogenase E1 component subunit alpha [Deltaproteobacteria bacterium]|nr:thiamine pyrophosphate-dependent dehydrogenase E1 component subunit alpha [Deltaproteobacteria bacterium]